MIDLTLARAAARAHDRTCPTLVLDLCDELDRQTARIAALETDLAHAEPRTEGAGAPRGRLMSDHDGHTIDVGVPYRVGTAPINLDAIRSAVWGGDARLIRRLCDEVDRLRAEITALAAVLADTLAALDADHDQ